MSMYNKIKEFDIEVCDLVGLIAQRWKEYVIREKRILTDSDIDNLFKVLREEIRMSDEVIEWEEMQERFKKIAEDIQ